MPVAPVWALRWCYTGQLATPTCNADSQRMFFARICRHVTLLNRFQKLPTRCSTANIAKSRSQRAVTLEWFFAQHHIIASWRCKLTSVASPLRTSDAAQAWNQRLMGRWPRRAVVEASDNCMCDYSCCNPHKRWAYVQRTSRLITPNVEWTTDVKAGRTPNFYATRPWSLQRPLFASD